MKHFLTVMFCVLSYITTAQSADSIAISNLSDAVLELQNSELMRNGTLAVSLKSTKDNRSKFALHPELSLPSASTLKLVTTATVLDIFGGDYRYKTCLEHDGVIRRDTLFGNIYVRGTGDPTLGSDRFAGYPNSTDLLAKWTKAIQKLGVKVVLGEVIGDGSYFDKNTVADSWIYADLGNYYGAGVSGLNFNDNLYKVKFRPGARAGDPSVYLNTDPVIPYITFRNEVTTGEKGSGDKTILYSNPSSNQVVMTGTVPAGFATYQVKGSIPDPASFVAYALQKALTDVQIKVVKPAIEEKTQATRKVLDETLSPPLRDICNQTNLWSVNLYADAFLKLAGKRLGGDPSFDASAKAVKSYWVTKRADMRGFSIKDGSGLSPSGSLSVHNLTDILSIASKNADFYKTIAILGQSGTVRNLGKGSRAAGNIRAKSGSIEGTRAYAGYVTSKSGEVLSFAIIAHKYEPESSRLVAEELVKLMVLMGEI
ncbi:MAG TPA: D-alanyl-D-alanine carboxypeptidase/D-alanyl-D-alanine-endopeptidase [Dyadobacter sp.]|jgi:D-alanyl-D-alanine carboxypeptidase/D-alanyl-D-alanine-endopeptidase (penicillin-binding protein 4)|nr:D-alanyl-D-alanine carboxypeptidase/D-alanyl-D-alanine-endopeptidase [Dyadobacter sp.]